MAQEAALIGAVLGRFTSNRWALTAAKWDGVALTVLQFLLSAWLAGECAGRMVERLDDLWIS